MPEQRKKRISGRALVILFAVLIAVVAVTAWLNLRGSRGDSGINDDYTIAVSEQRGSGKAQTVKTFSLGEIREMDAVTVHAQLQSAKEGSEEGRWTGVPVRDVIGKADGKLLRRTKTVLFKAGDGYTSAASATELRRGQAVLLVYSKDGKALKHFNDGGTGPLRVLFTEDTYGNRSTQYLKTILCRTD
ncbi:MAG: molybdopterin-dependent oxidoreductase [Anaerovoracaceae bacterium]|jgi:DMSO/TMAO reductase YedYZ molybdopterin-dependent catalytic subunit